jgi:hypothetical protein
VRLCPDHAPEVLDEGDSEHLYWRVA